MNLKNMLGQIEANGRDRRQIGDRFSHGRRSIRGCSTTTILAQLSIESDAGAGAVHIITFVVFLVNRAWHFLPTCLYFKALGPSLSSQIGSKSPILGECDNARRRHLLSRIFPFWPGRCVCLHCPSGMALVGWPIIAQPDYAPRRDVMLSVPLPSSPPTRPCDICDGYQQDRRWVSETTCRCLP
jgi:hypothetical protein